MRYVILLLLMLLALLQVTCIPPIPVLGIRPDLVLVLVLAWAVVGGPLEGAIAAFVGGLVLDILSNWPLGSHALLLTLVAVPCAYLATPLSRGNIAFPIVAAFIATAAYSVLGLLLVQSLGRPVPWGTLLWRTVLPLAVVEATLMPLVFWVLHWADERLHPRRRIA